jgi:S1-C subfamily serine protease
MTEGYRRNNLLVAVVIFLLINVGATVYLFTYSNHYISELRASNTLLQNQISSLNQEVESLRSQISLQRYINSSEFMALPQIYNQTMFSVVLIMVETSQGSAQGSGFVYDDEGRIITNNHVVEGASSIEITFIDGSIYSATIVGTDPYSDLAVIDVNVAPSLLHPLVLGNSSDLVVGETVIAIGNPYGLSNSMSAGIVSQLGRELSATGGYIIVDVIQTDAAINPGNSGGPMLNLRGEVVGMNTAILTTTGEWQGIGFAIPSDTIKREVLSLIQSGSYSHPYLGITGRDMTPDIAGDVGLPNTTKGVQVVSVNSPGPSAGKLQSNDVIIGVDGYNVKTFYDLILYIERNKRPGDTVSLSVLRKSFLTWDLLTVTITLGTRPPP